MYYPDFQDDRITMPESLLLVVDDVGWWLAGDQRYYVKVPPEAEAMMRRPYCMEDYRSLVELGRQTGMRILLGLTIGEWDRDRLLADLPHSNMYGRNWTNEAVLKDVRRLDETRDYLNAHQDCVEFAVHGLNHMYWDDDGNCLFAEYYHDENGVQVMTKPEILRAQLDAWFAIYERNGFRQKVQTLIPCCFRYKYSRGDGELSYILKDYGIRYVNTPFSSLKYDTPGKPVGACVENGILTTDRTNDLSPWHEMDARIPDAFKSSYYGTHWPHFIAADPADNMKTVQRWAAYFLQYRSRFGVWMAPDHAHGAAQCFYRRFTTAEPTGERRWRLDFTEADAQQLPRDSVGNSIILQIRKPWHLTCGTPGCSVELVDFNTGFGVWKLTRSADCRAAELFLTE